MIFFFFPGVHEPFLNPAFLIYTSNHVMLCVSWRLAEEELLRESERAKARCEVVGIEGFRKCPVPRTNKRFLINTIVNNIKSNNIKSNNNKSNNINKSQQLKKRKHSLNTSRKKCDKKIIGEKTDQKGTISKKERSSKKWGSPVDKTADLTAQCTLPWDAMRFNTEMIPTCV